MHYRSVKFSLNMLIEKSNRLAVSVHFGDVAMSHCNETSALICFLRAIIAGVFIPQQGKMPTLRHGKTASCSGGFAVTAPIRGNNASCTT